MARKRSECESQKIGMLQGTQCRDTTSAARNHSTKLIRPCPAWPRFNHLSPHVEGLLGHISCPHPIPIAIVIRYISTVCGVKRVAGLPPPKEEYRGVDHSHWRQAEIPWSSQPQQTVVSVIGILAHRRRTLIFAQMLNFRANNGVPRVRDIRTL
jgi:hypothetical protein